MSTGPEGRRPGKGRRSLPQRDLPPDERWLCIAGDDTYRGITPVNMAARYAKEAITVTGYAKSSHGAVREEAGSRANPHPAIQDLS